MMKKYCLTLALLLLLAGCTEPISDSLPTDVLPPLTEASGNGSQTTATEEASFDPPPQEVLLKTADTLEVYEDITVGDFISETNAVPVNSTFVLDTNMTGRHTVPIRLSFGGNIFEKKAGYIVKDTTPPLLLKSGDGSTVETGSDFDLNDYVGYADNFDRSPKLTYTGTVDTSVPGSYPLTACVKDASGNSTEWELTINVRDEIPRSEDDDEHITFSQFAERYGGKGRRLGIDVSKWQEDIDFNAVKNAGCEYVIIRVGSYYDEYTEDPYFKSNLAAAKAAGLDVGVYIYTTVHSAEDVKKNAKWVSDMLGGEKLQLPVVFDWENFFEFQSYGMNIRDLNNYFRLFAEEVKSYGFDAMLYSSKNFLNNFWEKQEDYPVWLAHYTDETDYEGSYVMWQATSRGRIDGIEGNVDFNVMYNN